jgi:hypothetical protein
VVAQTDFAPGTVVALESMTEAIAFSPVASATVDADGKVQFGHLLPGEYRLVEKDASGQIVLATDPFGVSRTETSVTFLTPPPAATP